MSTLEWCLLGYAVLVVGPADRRQRIFNLLVMLDQCVWVIITAGHGHPDETISAACWRMELAGKRQGRVFRRAIDWLFRPFERDHCYQSYLSERARRQLPPEYR